MVALIFLSASESSVVRFGGIEDPRYRPYPGSKDDTEPADWEEEAPQARRGGPNYFDQMAQAKFWRRHDFAHGLLVVQSASGFEVVGVANAASVSARRNKTVRDVRVSDWIVFENPVGVSSLQAAVGARVRPTLTDAINQGLSRSLPGKTGAELGAAMRILSTEYEPAIERLPPRPVIAIRNTTRVEQYDANMTALRIFDRRDWRAQRPRRPESLSAFVESVDQASASENDFIQDDLTGFLDWHLQGSNRGWFEFIKGERRLLLKNINVSTAEGITGADLVYVTHEPDAVVLVQYKKLEFSSNQGLYVRHDSRMQDQARRLMSFSPDEVDRGDDEDEARLGVDFSFFKFVSTKERWRVDERDLPAAWYMPVDSVRRMMVAPDLGTKGGAIYQIPEHRTIDPEVFARLVRDRWIGASSSLSRDLFEILGRPLSSARTLTLAVDEPNVD